MPAQSSRGLHRSQMKGALCEFVRKLRPPAWLLLLPRSAGLLARLRDRARAHSGWVPRLGCEGSRLAGSALDLLTATVNFI